MMMIVLRLLSLLGLNPEGIGTSVRAPWTGVFFHGDRIGGFVDSGPETLVPSASNRSTPEWTPVDSVDTR